ncbi:Protein of unknown function DUF3210 [Penicillium argentinense]|uniref:Altered inheritance of mitochondria protein 21 n=1 Tax=Penicillium argentinense TaxID=1131581 RepID=A0A9W9FNW9_9EURO|nr:Protein of unknown function DUF3210 [Penicillium argentinense]KAJ5103645.1 Protein of unknown function DUF3210 [Penicillium argentinense]
MSTQTSPVVPPRPARSPRPPSSTDMPRIPPRPSNRRADRSLSPMCDSYAPSPLNEWNGPSMSRTTSNDIPQRPPSVTIPSLGEEGIEYADLDVGHVSDSHHQAPAETRNVSSELKIHAPRPSLPTSSAKAKVQAVTRTDSRQAAAAGLGRESSPAHDESERPSRSLHSRASGSRGDSSTASTDRRQSAQLADEHGFRVPMYPNAGDVQAPSPSPYLDQGSQRPGRNHNRSRSGRDSSLPPGSYGLHGHGVQHTDKFEKAWYEKHPDEFAKEEGQYGPGIGTPRPDWALSRDDLNKIVRSSDPTPPGNGTSPSLIGTPEEEVGYLASDEYMHHMASPPPDARNENQPSVESPLRQMSFPASETESRNPPKSQLRHGRSSSRGHHTEGDVIHVDDPMHHLHHPDGFAPTPAIEDQTTEAEEPRDDDEPILAADQVRPESAYLHPAVSPSFEHRGSFDEDYHSRSPSASHSRSNSRSASAQGAPMLTRFDSRELQEDTHTPLEDVEEYEPLFPEEETKKEKPLSAADRFKDRPDALKHRFPSQDIWEDTPNSLQLHATVNTPDLPKSDSETTFETPEQEAQRRMQASKIDSHQVASQILEGEAGRDKEKAPTRPDTLKQRFPSRDIWEDAPDSQQLVTTIEPAKDEVKSPEVPSKPSIPPRPQKQLQSTSPTEKRQAPVIPDRPKPQIPARPSRPSSQATKEPSIEEPAVPKAKPAVPARPGGSKIAALKAGFLTDLNSRLQLGPQQPKLQEKEPEPPAEKQPLSDARKGRARGPARRKPAAEKPIARLPVIPEIKITETWNVWQVGEDGNLTVGDTKPIEFTAVPPEPVHDEPEAKQPVVPEPTETMAEDSTDSTSKPPAATETVSPSAVDVPEINPIDSETLEPASEPVETLESTSEDIPKQNEPESSPAGAISATHSPSEATKLDDAAEDMAAFADGKKSSDGDIHPVESAS